MSGSSQKPIEAKDNSKNSPEDQSTASPEKKRSKINVTTSPIPIHSSNKEGTSSPSSSSVAVNRSISIPPWVAGASPAKFISLADLMAVNDSVEKMAIAHQIAIEPNCKVEDLVRRDKLYETVKTKMHKAFWDLLRDELARGQPNNEHVCGLLKDLKQMITEHLETANLRNALLTAVDEVLDLDHLRSLLERGVLNLEEVLRAVLGILEKLCAPIRDEAVAKLRTETNLIELFKGVFELVEQMQLDMANFTLTQHRQLIGSYSAQIEHDEFMKVLAIDAKAADNTKSWLRRVLTSFVSSSPELVAAEELSRSHINEVIVHFYLALLTTPSDQEGRPPFPETLKLDEQRIAALSEKFLQLVLTIASIFVTSNLVGKSVCERKEPPFKAQLKCDLLMVLGDVEWTNYVRKLDNVCVQCDKKCVEALPEGGWSAESSQLLRQQLRSLEAPDDPVRTIASARCSEFIGAAIRRSGAPLRVPAGLSTVQTELASLAAHFYAPAVHNWNAFGRFYARLLDEEWAQMRAEKSAS